MPTSLKEHTIDTCKTWNLRNTSLKKYVLMTATKRFKLSLYLSVKLGIFKHKIYFDQYYLLRQFQLYYKSE